MGGWLRNRHNFPADPRERHATWKDGIPSRLGTGPIGRDFTRFVLLSRSKEGFEALTKFARQSDRDCHARLIGAGFDSSERLPRSPGATRETELRESSRFARSSHRFAIMRHRPCHLLFIVA